MYYADTKSIKDWTLKESDNLECKQNSYTDQNHYTPSFEFQDHVYRKMQGPNVYAITAHYNLSEAIKATNTDFEFGIDWFNYDFSKNRKSKITAFHSSSNRLNLNT